MELKNKTITILAFSKYNTPIDATNLAGGIYYLSVERFRYSKPIKFVD